jgi:hypothetical protein
MWSAIIGILSAVLGIAKEYLTWQVALTKINVRKIAYDIDQAQLKVGKDLLSKIDAAKDSGDLAAASLLLNDAAANALYVADIRSSIPDLSESDLGISSGIPEASTPSSGPDYGTQPTQGTVSGIPSVNVSVGLGVPGTLEQKIVGIDPIMTKVPVTTQVPSHTIPAVPYSVTGIATWFGWNPPTAKHPDGTDDTGDQDKYGNDLLGAFGDHTHNEQIVGISIPIPIFHATIGSGNSTYVEVRNRRYLFDVWCHSTGRHATGVWLVDLGPSASLNRVADMTYGLGTMLGLNDTAIVTWSVTDTHTGKILEIKGYDFVNNKVNV